MSADPNDIIKEVLASAASMGSVDATWLKKREMPKFTTVEPGGQGPEIVMLHGLLGALSNWDSTLPFFQKFSNPLCLEFAILKGPAADIRVKSLAAYTEAFVRQRNLGPAILCGNSLGGHVALRVALARPELVDCMILSGSSGLYEHSVDALPVRPSKPFLREHMGRVFAQQRFVTDQAIDEVHEILHSKMNLLNIIASARSAKKDNLIKVLNQIKIPTLLLWGEDDQVTTMQVAELFHQHMPNSTLKSIKNCGHAPMIEHPEWFAEETHKFLQQHSARFRKA